jgi:hypothetical protein
VYTFWLFGNTCYWEVEQLSTTTNRESIGETCVICEIQKNDGIHLYTSFICTDCENEMIHTQTSHPNYKFFLQQMRKVNQPTIFS